MKNKLMVLVIAGLMVLSPLVGMSDGMPLHFSVTTTDAGALIVPAPTYTTNVWAEALDVSAGTYISAHTNNATRYMYASVGGTTTNVVPDFGSLIDVVDNDITWRPVKNERSKVTICNNGAGVVYLSFATTTNSMVSGNGIRLSAGATHVEEVWKGEIRAISTAGITNIVSGIEQ